MRPFKVQHSLWFRLWAIFLAVYFLASLALTWQRVGSLPDLAAGCDLFGHLQHAKEIREARSQGRVPRLDFHGEKVDQLLKFLKTQPDDPKSWQYLPAPHAFMYRSASDKVINQYPPGTAQLLALFPQQGLSGIVRAGLLFSALLWFGLGIAFWRRLDIVGLTALTLLCEQIGFSLRELALSNPSAHATLIPVALGALLLGACWTGNWRINFRQRARIATTLLTFVGGILLGYAIYIRPPNALLIPVFFFLARGRDKVVLSIAVFLAGILPLALYQSQYAGAWFKTTYGEMDSSLPALRTIPGYLKFYLKNQDEGGRFFAHSFFIAMLCLGARARLRPWIWVWIPSLAFFVTHSIPTVYYLAPANIALSALLVASLLTRDGVAVGARRRWVLLATALLWTAQAGIGVIRDLRADPPPAVSPTEAERFLAERIPRELLDPRAWVWSDQYSGSFWYYARKPAFRIAFWVPPTLRDRTSRWVQRVRQEPQFLVMDGENSREVFEDWRQKGARLTSRGQVFGVEYFQIFWN